MTNIIGERLRIARTARNMTQEDVARAVGTTKQNIWKYETGVITNIPVDRVNLLGNVLMVNPSWIMGWCSDMRMEVDRPLSKKVRERINAELSVVDPIDLEEARKTQNIELLDRLVEEDGPVSIDDAYEVSNILGISLYDLIGEEKPAEEGVLSVSEFTSQFEKLSQDNQERIVGLMRALVESHT